MRIAFFQDVWTDLNGPLLLAQLLEEEGHDVRFVLAQKGWEKTLAAYAPQVVGLSTFTGNHLDMFAAAKRIKETCPGPPLVVMGGPHPTFFPSALEHPSVDAICRGEAETAFPLFLDRLRDGKLDSPAPNFLIKVSGGILEGKMGRLVRDLDSLPIASRRHLYDHYPLLARAPFMRVTVRRGCPFSCSYCFNAPFRRMTKGLGPYIRTRSPEHVIEELAYLHQRYGCRHIIFSDDVFTLSRKWIFDFAQQMARLPMTYDIATCAQYLDRDVVRALAESGCTLVGMGIETGDEALRRGLLNKKLKNEEIFRAARELARAGIQVQTYNMIGFPGETLDHALETIRFNQRIKPDYALCCIATPYPGTSLSQRWTAIEGTSEKEILSLVGKSFFHRSLLPGKEARLFTNLQKFFALAVRHPSLEPLVRLLVRLPPNPVFHEFFQLYHGLHMMRRLKASPIFALSLFFRLRRHF